MIINNNLQKNLVTLRQNIDLLIENNSLTNLQIENFLRSFEKTRYNILNEIKLYNKNFENVILKIYVPEVITSYNNLKTHTHKRILLNVAEITKQYADIFENDVFIFIKIYDKLLGWDIDNKYIKPIADALILSKVIQDDNITKMSYAAKGEFSENPHTEIYVFDAKKANEFLENYSMSK